MSTPSLNEADWPWDEFTNFFDQSTSSLHALDSVEPPLQLDDFIEGSVQDVTSHADVSDLQSSCKIPRRREARTTEPSERNIQPKTKKTRKEKLKGGLEQSSQSVIERRRAQVRLAQQAYRNREKGTIASLQRDVNDLKMQLAEMERISDELFELTCCLNLPEKAKKAIQRLQGRKEQPQSPHEMHDITEPNPKNTGFADRNDTSSVLPYSSAHISDIASAWSPLHRLSDNHFSMSQVSQPRSLIDQSSYSFDIYQNLDITPLSFLGNFNESPLAFFFRLRDESLIGAYSLITKPETPYSMLCKKFRSCIFSSTRNEIISRLGFLIQQCAKMTCQPNSTSIVTDTESSSDDSSGFSSCSVTEETSYIPPEGLGDYLSKVGLEIDPGSPFAEFSMTPEKTIGPTATVFDELRQKEKIRISLSKLFHELLDRMVCLGMGPGILAAKIDEAIQSTLIGAF